MVDWGIFLLPLVLGGGGRCYRCLVLVAVLAVAPVVRLRFPLEEDEVEEEGMEMGMGVVVHRDGDRDVDAGLALEALFGCRYHHRSQHLRELGSLHRRLLVLHEEIWYS